MGKVECLSETVNITLATIQLELERLSSENDDQKFDIEQLTTQNEQQQSLLDEQKKNIDQLFSDNAVQQNAIDTLAIENDEQGSQLEEHQFDIVKFTKAKLF